MKMPFGLYGPKHQKIPYTVEAVAAENPEYLIWALDDVNLDRWPGLTEEIRTQLNRRGKLPGGY